jgi:S-formylglutathione hydrolase
MGGHGALIIGLKNQHAYTSISAFAPIVSPSQCPWGEKALTAYLGDDKNPWKQVDACEILNELGRQTTLPILIDQGLDDDFYLSQKLTKPFEECCLEQGVAAQIRYHPHYDHSYYFIASFIEQHLSFHGQYLFD